MLRLNVPVNNFSVMSGRSHPSWVINQYFWGVKCLAQGHNTAAVGFEPPTSRSGVRHSTTEPPRSPDLSNDLAKIWDNGGQIDTFTLDFEKAVRAPQEQTVWLWHTWEDPEIDHHSFLCYRQQRVVLNGAKSDWARCCLVSRRTLSLVPCCFPGTLMISQQTLILKQDSLRMTVFVTEKLRIQRTH